LDAIQHANITPGVIRKYLDHKGTVSANREIAALSAAWSYCYQRDIVTVPNPCLGVDRITEKPRKRYVTETEYKQAYETMPKHIQVAMELAYLCRMRLSEVLDARVKDIEPEGLNIRRLKGSDDALTLWSPRLEKAVNRGLEGCIRTPEMTIVNRNGSPIRRSSFQTTWQRRMKTFEPRFSFHDLKAAGVSDFDGDKKKASGHKSERMVNVYDRKRIVIDATE
jgi:integrase